MQIHNASHGAVMPRIIAIACVFALSGCSSPPTIPMLQPVHAQEHSHHAVRSGPNQQIVCRTNNHLYPCILTSSKTPIAPSSDTRPSERVSQAAQAPPSQAGDAALLTAGAHAEHQAIARQLQEITATLGPFLADLAEPKSGPARTVQAEPVVPLPSPPPGGPVDEGAPPHREASGQELERVKHESTQIQTQRDEFYKTTIAPQLNDMIAEAETFVDQKPAPGQVALPPHATPDAADSQLHSPSQFTPSNSDLSGQNRKLWVKLLASVYFPSNSAELLPSEKIVLIDLLPLVRDKQLLFVGYADRDSDENTNSRLSYERARAVKAFFLHTRHNPAKLFAGGRGSCCYKTDGNTPTERQQNRRVEIYHTPERLQLTVPPFSKE